MSFFYLTCQRGSDFAATGFALQMCCIGLELRGEMVYQRTQRREFSVGDGPRKFCVALVHSGFERGGVERSSGNGELVDKRQMKTARRPAIRGSLLPLLAYTPNSSGRNI